VNQVFIDSAHHFDTKPVLVDSPPWMREIDEHLLVYLVLQCDHHLVVEILADLNRNGADDIRSGHETWRENNFALRLEFRTAEDCLMFQVAYTRGSVTDREQSPGEEHAGTIFRPPGRSATLFIIELIEKEALEFKQRLCVEEFDPRPFSVTLSIYLNVNSCASRLRSVDRAFVDAATRFRMKPVLVNSPPWL
jgi:hypothetical protein